MRALRRNLRRPRGFLRTLRRRRRFAVRPAFLRKAALDFRVRAAFLAAALRRALLILRPLRRRRRTGVPDAAALRRRVRHAFLAAALRFDFFVVVFRRRFAAVGFRRIRRRRLLVIFFADRRRRTRRFGFAATVLRALRARVLRTRVLRVRGLLFVRRAARAFFRFRRAAARCLAVALRFMPGLLFVGRSVRPSPARRPGGPHKFFVNFFRKFFRISRLRAARARRSRAFALSRRVLLGVFPRRAYAPRPLMAAMWVTPALRRSDDPLLRVRVRLRGALT